jgi:hypothetical protein
MRKGNILLRSEATGGQVEHPTLNIEFWTARGGSATGRQFRSANKHHPTRTR